MKIPILAAASGLAFSASLIVSPAVAQGAGEHVDANGMPTTHSTPQEQADTAAINRDEATKAAAANAQANEGAAAYQAQQQQYQQQQQQYQRDLERNQAQQQGYRDRTAVYQDLRARYAAERSAYRRGVWPDHYARLELNDRDTDLVGERVALISGSRVGTVIDMAHAPGGAIEALLVRLDDDKLVWIDAGDVRYSRSDGTVMTNLAASDLHHMADERL